MNNFFINGPKHCPRSYSVIPTTASVRCFYSEMKIFSLTTKRTASKSRPWLGGIRYWSVILVPWFQRCILQSWHSAHAYCNRAMLCKSNLFGVLLCTIATAINRAFVNECELRFQRLRFDCNRSSIRWLKTASQRRPSGTFVLARTMQTQTPVDSLCYSRRRMLPQQTVATSDRGYYKRASLCDTPAACLPSDLTVDSRRASSWRRVVAPAELMPLTHLLHASAHPQWRCCWTQWLLRLTHPSTSSSTAWTTETRERRHNEVNL